MAFFFFLSIGAILLEDTFFVVFNLKLKKKKCLAVLGLSCSAQILHCNAWASLYLQFMGLLAPGHVGS